MCFEHESHWRNHVSRLDLVSTRIVRSTSNHSVFLNEGCWPCKLLNELECIAHQLNTIDSLLPNSHHWEQSWLETVLKHKGGALSLFEVEGDVAHAAHMEEGFVLNFTNARVVQVPSVHETTGSDPHVIPLCWVATDRLWTFAALLAGWLLQNLRRLLVPWLFIIRQGSKSRWSLTSLVNFLRWIINSVPSSERVDCPLH